MDKQKLRKYLRSFLRGQLSKEGEQIFNRWVNSLDSQSSDSISDKDLDDSLRRIKLKIDSSIHQKYEPAFSFFSWKIAASIILLVGICYTFFKLNLLNESKSTETKLTTIVANRAQMTSAILPDSSIVWLNADSKITFPSTFSDTIREVRLTGEAFFQIKRNTKLPFIVQTANESTRVLGTSFLIRAYPTDSTVVVAVHSGRVSVTAFDKNLSNGENFILTKNDMVEHDIAHNRTTTRQVPIENLIEWTEGTIVFANKSLLEIVPILERWYNVEIEVKNPALLKKKFNAKFKNESVQHVLKSLSLSGSFSYKITDKQVTLFSN